MQIKQIRDNKDFNFDIIRGGTMFNETTSYEMNDMYFKFVKSRECKEKDLERLGKKGHHELKDWMTPIEREEMLKECLVRLIKSDDEREEHYLDQYEYEDDLG